MFTGSPLLLTRHQIMRHIGCCDAGSISSGVSNGLPITLMIELAELRKLNRHDISTLVGIALIACMRFRSTFH